ncbi:MAG: hypothetical protein JO180_03860 [Gemmatirosa sp.]|nr:hypothetical protein [Gemmatirosa sp.]
MPTDYETELARIDRDLAGESTGVTADLSPAMQAMLHASRLYQRASLTGDLVALDAADAAADAAIAQTRVPDDLYLLKAQIAMKLHRLDEVRRNLDAVPALRETPDGMALLADVDFQEGRYDEARRGYEAAIARDRTWDALARLAHVAGKMDDAAAADRLYAEAEDELTAKQMRSYAWVQLQRGTLDVAEGRLDDAAAHYDRAARAYSGYWLVDEHVAALTAARHDMDAAIARYEDVVARVPKPELKQTLGELYAAAGQRERAQPLLEQAQSAYLDSVARGGVHYYHHLTDLYAGPLDAPAEAVRWARMDLALRRNFNTLAALAWALHRAGDAAEASDTMAEALASGVNDAHLYAHAATIFRAAGRTDEGERAAKRAGGAHHHHGHFHVHHH